MRVAARQVSVVVLGVVVAAVAAVTLPTVAALAIATGAGILVGRAKQLGSSYTQPPTFAKVSDQAGFTVHHRGLRGNGFVHRQSALTP